MFTIYLLKDPAQRIGYVGQTRHTAHRRLRQHLNNALHNERRSRSGKVRWLQQLIAEATAPTVVILEMCETGDAANEAEARWIARCQETDGLELVNATTRGVGVYPNDQGSRISAAMQRPATRARKIRAGKLVAATTWADPAIAARRAAGMKRSWTPERREAARRRWADPAWRAKTLAAQRAIFSTLTEWSRKSRASKAYARKSTTRLRVSGEMKARWADPTTRRKTIAAMKASTYPAWRAKRKR